LIKIVLSLLEENCYPVWPLKDPVNTLQSLSKDQTLKFEVPLQGGKYTTAQEIFESYFSAYERYVREPDCELLECIEECRDLLHSLHHNPERFARSVDWAAKKAILSEYIEAQHTSWKDPILQSLELEYHLIDPEKSLYNALLEIDRIDPEPPLEDVLQRTHSVFEPTRAAVRAHAIQHFVDHISSLSWGTLEFEADHAKTLFHLDPLRKPPKELFEAPDVNKFIQKLKETL
jgi:proteasome accessory factor A